MRKGRQEALGKPILGRSRTGGLSREYSKADQLVTDFNTMMIEGLSLAVKDFNEKVVDEVNRL